MLSQTISIFFLTFSIKNFFCVKRDVDIPAIKSFNEVNEEWTRVTLFPKKCSLILSHAYVKLFDKAGWICFANSFPCSGRIKNYSAPAFIHIPGKFLWRTKRVKPGEQCAHILFFMQVTLELRKWSRRLSQYPFYCFSYVSLKKSKMKSFFGPRKKRNAKTRK